MATVHSGQTFQAETMAVILPTLTLVTLVLVAVLPWGLPSAGRFVLPMLPYVAVHYWTLNRRGLMPPVLVFIAGLFIDFVTYGPIGFWSMIYLIGYLLAHWSSGPFGRTRPGRYASYVATLVILGALQWLSASFYFAAPVDWEPFTLAVGIAALFYPLLALFLRVVPR